MTTRLVIFCLVPKDLEKKLLRRLSRHYARDPRVRVIVDRRREDRRSPRDGPLLPSREEDRRSGTDRRRPVLERAIASLPQLPDEQAERIRFVQRLLPVSSNLEALPADEIVQRVRDGDPEAPTELYWRCYERIHSRLSVLLGDPESADREVGAAFGRVVDAIEAAEGPLLSFSDLLYGAVDAGLVEEPDAAEEPAGELELPDGPSLAISDPMLDEPVVVSDRDPRWFSRAQAERDTLLRKAGPHIVAIEHVGGTAIPALPGRPIVDLLVGVEAMPVPVPLHALLLERGYENCGDAGTPGRAYYRSRGLARYDLHVVEHGSALWQDPIRLREHLRRHNPDAHRWASARREAARGAGDSLMRYAERRAHALAALLSRVEEESSQRAG